ncbi:Hypothetical protein, putative [Bodo saltans]|uniref:Uncharacterized protein n=1 Tax=Bodo saltans TaxID=75058 RepID=A0A0S4J9B7_BODSA|nr:Hypothetical protein, putative [Bodo saltans]|eukprot:CUG88014.1 Hypothetical protein, putative [Bodo saltans]
MRRWVNKLWLPNTVASNTNPMLDQLKTQHAPVSKPVSRCVCAWVGRLVEL